MGGECGKTLFVLSFWPINLGIKKVNQAKPSSVPELKLCRSTFTIALKASRNCNVWRLDK